MIGALPWSFSSVQSNPPQLRLVDRYARWEYDMPDATPLLRAVEGRRGSRRAPRPAPRAPYRSRRALHPLRFLAVLIAPRHR